MANDQAHDTRGTSANRLAQAVSLSVAGVAASSVDGQTFWGGYTEITQPSASIFSDDFNSGDLSHVENGAEWKAQRATSLVNSNGCVIFNTSGAAIDPPTCGFSYKEWEGWLNNISMRFRYGVDDAFPMQTWSLNQPAARVRDIWFRISMRVPISYEHVNNSGSSTNNKFFALWMDGRETNSDNGATVVFQTRETSITGSVGSALGFYVWNNANGNGDQASFSDFWSVPEVEGSGVRDDRGRWQDIVLHMKANDAGSGTGKIQAWRRWQDEAEYSLLINKDLDVPIPNTGYDGWDTCQIMGGDNSWLAESTEILMDSFYASDASLVPAGTEGL